MWVSLQRLGLVALFGLVGIYAAVSLRQIIPQLRQQRQHIREMNDYNASLKREIEVKREGIEKLKHDSGAQRDLVRDELHLQRKGETTFIVPDEPPPADSPRAQ